MGSSENGDEEGERLMTRIVLKKVGFIDEEFDDDTLTMRMIMTRSSEAGLFFSCFFQTICLMAFVFD